MTNEKIRVGKIVKGFGIKGEVKVKIFTDFPEKRFKSKKILYIERETGFLDVVIESVRYHQEHALIKFVGYPDLTSVEHLAQSDIYVDRSSIDTKENVYYFQLMNMEVIDENDKVIGIVSDVMETAAHAVIRIKTEGKDILIPYVDAFILDVNDKKNQIKIKWMEGL